MMTNKHRILCDLSLGHISAGFSGIPQDTRLLFAGLARSEKIDLTGHLFGIAQDPFYLKSQRKFSDIQKQEQVSVFLGTYLHKGNLLSDQSNFWTIISRVFPRFYRLYQRYMANSQSNFKLHHIPEEFYGSVWRQIFSKTLSPEDYAYFEQCQYQYSQLSIARCAHALHGRMPTPFLNTEGYDFALFQDSRGIKISSKTITIVRYHDGLPFFSADTMGNMFQTLGHIRGIRANQDAVFVCNSTASINDLSHINPKAAEHACVIPYFLPKMKKPMVTDEILKDICQIRISNSTQADGKTFDMRKWFGEDKKIPKFILSLATIEPRKNFIGLIEAWLKLRYDTGEDIKLMIVGKPGWEFEPTLKVMRPLVKQGHLIHLENVAQLELPYLYAAAACFVFPSFGEGFGLPPNEAMQCDCPVAVSDIPAHRYSCGDGAQYFNPYDIDEMANTIAQLLDRKNNANMIDDLIAKGHKNIERYSITEVLPMWEDLFDKLKSGKK